MRAAATPLSWQVCGLHERGEERRVSALNEGQPYTVGSDGPATGFPLVIREGPERKRLENDLTAPRTTRNGAVMSERPAVILLVDDDPDTRDMYAWALETHGFRVVHAATAAAGITAAATERPDVVVSDFKLPGADGFVLAARVRDTAALAGTPLILLSGHAFSGPDGERAGQLFDRVLLKPVLPDHLIGEIQRQLDV